MSAMAGTALVVGIDQGTTGTTVLLVDSHETVHGRGYAEIPQSFPRPGWVEHDPEAIWNSVLAALGGAAKMAGLSKKGAKARTMIAAIGITNQRETIVLWERATGKPVAPAIVWQDRRTSDICESLRRAGHEGAIAKATGLVIDPYFSATKIAWLFDNIPGLRARATAGKLACGTIDSYLVWRLSGGRSHITDVSNASRTSLFDLNTLAWSDDLCRLFNVPKQILPEVRPSSGNLATAHGVPGIPQGTPIAGIAGDQQAALFGQGCRETGDAKCTYGTGSFLLMNVGPRPVISRHRLLGTVAWTVAGGTSFALEGSAFICGALVQWLRDGLGIISKAAEVEALARSVPDAGGVTIVPALAGLGAPHWRAEARGLIWGITRGTTKAHIARAALEAMAMQNVGLLRAMEGDCGQPVKSLRVDGGAAANDLLMQIQADLLGVDIVRPGFLELTALGAVRLAALGAGLDWNTPSKSKSGRGTKVFHPSMPEPQRQEALARWQICAGKA